MQMIKEDNTTIYFVIAVIFHSLFIVSINPFSVIKDVAVIGESGMNVQMILIQKGDENFDKAIMSENKRNELDDAEKDQEVILDDRKVGDISKNAYQSYYGQVRKIIDSNKKYPLLARQRREEGSPRITFTILKNGLVENVSVMTSGYRSLDREARRMILASSPFPPIPASMKKEYIQLTIPINFNLYAK
tara:strand:+ start:29 stop:598 length:570 start_codon:yes stop_codon:yes gene_type:complete